MKKYNVEYLVGFNSSTPYCKSQNTYKTLLSTIDKVEIKSNSLIRYDGIIVQYKLKTHKKNDSSMKYYSVNFGVDYENEISKFTIFLSNHRNLISKIASTEIENIWNDLSLYFSTKAYPYINRIENKMRKLITTFMLINIGEEWTKYNVPAVVKNSLRKESKNIRANFLHEIDFIKLSDFLFKKYQDRNIEELYKLLANTQGDISVKELEKFIPKSNWERHFSQIVNCDDSYMLKKWEELYKLRCKVAHNNAVNKTDFDNIEKLSKDIGNKLTEALSNIDKISLSDDDKNEMSLHFNETMKDSLRNFSSFATKLSLRNLVFSDEYKELLNGYKELFGEEKFNEELSKLFTKQTSSIIGTYKLKNSAWKDDNKKTHETRCTNNFEVPQNKNVDELDDVNSDKEKKNLEKNEEKHK